MANGNKGTQDGWWVIEIPGHQPMRVQAADPNKAEEIARKEIFAARDQDQDGYVRGEFLPIKRNVETGNISPGMSEQMLRMKKLALEGPQRDPVTGNISDQDIATGLDLGGISPTGVVGAGVRGMSGAGRQIRNAINREETARQAVEAAGEFGVGLNRGQATGDIPTQETIEAAKGGAFGAEPQRIANEARRLQDQQIADAMQREGEAFSPGPGRPDDIQAAGNVARGVRDVAQTFRGNAQRAYRAAEEAGGTLYDKAPGRLHDAWDDVLQGEYARQPGGEIRADLPNVASFMRQIDEIRQGVEGREPGIGVPWQEMEALRKRLVADKSTGNEGRIIGQMRDAFDDWLDKTIEEGLMSGDPEFLDQLKAARGLWRNYRQITNDPNTVVRRMAESGAEDTDVANWLYGRAKLGDKQGAGAVAQRVVQLLGRDNQAVMDLRRGVVDRMFADARTREANNQGIRHLTVADQMNEFLNRGGRDLARALFTREEIAQLNRFQQMLRRIPADPEAQNPSKSGFKARGGFADMARRIGPIIGYSFGDITGAVGVYLGQEIADRAASMRRSRQVRREVSEPTRPMPRQPSSRMAMPTLQTQAASPAGEKIMDLRGQGQPTLADELNSAMEDPPYPNREYGRTWL